MRKLIKAEMDDEAMMSAYLICYQVLISTSHHLIEKYTSTSPHKKRFAYQINKIMNIKQLNELPITDFLSKIGVEPSYTKEKTTGIYPLSVTRSVLRRFG